MDLKVLGCHGGETPRHRTSSFLIGDRVALDAGAITSSLSLEEQQRIEAVVISHAHMDHVRDLATIADNRCQQGGPTLRIVGTPATVKALREHFFNDRLWPDFSKIPTPGGPTIEFVAINPEIRTEIGGVHITPIMVNHTIETAAFVVEQDGHSLTYSGDTGPTERLWEVVNGRPNLGALVMEVSFPNEQGDLARISGHHTPETLATELGKLEGHADLPILLFHIKPVFQATVEKQLARIKNRNLTILQLGDQFQL